MIALIAAVLVTGSWQYDGFFFEGHRYPNPNPSLVLVFTFREDGTSRLIWHRENEPGFCEREATYQIKDDYIHQKVSWLNPANASECSKDPDMRMGQETVSRFAVTGGELHFFFDLDGKQFIYILRGLDAREIEARIRE